MLSLMKIKPDATNPSGEATGIFQLMFGGKFGDRGMVILENS